MCDWSLTTCKELQSTLTHLLLRLLRGASVIAHKHIPKMCNCVGAIRLIRFIPNGNLMHCGIEKKAKYSLPQ